MTAQSEYISSFKDPAGQMSSKANRADCVAVNPGARPVY